MAAAVERLERIRTANFPDKVTHYSQGPTPDHGLPHTDCRSYVLGWDLFRDDWEGVDCEPCLDNRPLAAQR